MRPPSAISSAKRYDHTTTTLDSRPKKLTSELLDLWEHAAVLYHGYEWGQAAEAFRDLARRVPSEEHRTLCGLNATIIQARLGDYATARETLREVARNNERVMLTQYLMAILKWELGDCGGALRWMSLCRRELQGRDINYAPRGLDFTLRTADVHCLCTVLERSIHGTDGPHPTAVPAVLPAECIFKAPPRASTVLAEYTVAQTGSRHSAVRASQVQMADTEETPNPGSSERPPLIVPMESRWTHGSSIVDGTQSKTPHPDTHFTAAKRPQVTHQPSDLSQQGSSGSVYSITGMRKAIRATLTSNNSQAELIARQTQALPPPPSEGRAKGLPPYKRGPPSFAIIPAKRASSDKENQSHSPLYASDAHRANPALSSRKRPSAEGGSSVSFKPPGSARLLTKSPPLRMRPSRPKILQWFSRRSRERSHDAAEPTPSKPRYVARDPRGEYPDLEELASFLRHFRGRRKRRSLEIRQALATLPALQELTAFYKASGRDRLCLNNGAFSYNIARADLLIGAPYPAFDTNTRLKAVRRNSAPKAFVQLDQADQDQARFEALYGKLPDEDQLRFERLYGFKPVNIVESSTRSNTDATPLRRRSLPGPVDQGAATSNIRSFEQAKIDLLWRDLPPLPRNQSDSASIARIRPLNNNAGTAERNAEDPPYFLPSTAYSPHATNTHKQQPAPPPAPPSPPPPRPRVILPKIPTPRCPSPDLIWNLPSHHKPNWPFERLHTHASASSSLFAESLTTEARRTIAQDAALRMLEGRTRSKQIRHPAQDRGSVAWANCVACGRPNVAEEEEEGVGEGGEEEESDESPAPSIAGSTLGRPRMSSGKIFALGQDAMG
ncbi:hypothetical protein BAUCODRAFT_179441 [Baudoinia panamericana UAMH 10762]|uniref:Uncharacterized protein n=1 Tax=Baudoinia panamericana (strain UAMH 10762) TaxID=717646 RepID=M2M0Y1_BAUPA|nr:uncharacterized protein BAUCODRAFT_179441 [Baudoinia panamericana UAMH 10762]EMD00683.1 hypothetical protein BAUCODRAFT_179441 [Baudoinia panamericana UAMH 10762]